MLIADLLKKWTIQHDGPISCLKLFSLNAEVHTPSFVSQGKFVGTIWKRKKY